MKKIIYTMLLWACFGLTAVAQQTEDGDTVCHSTTPGDTPYVDPLGNMPEDPRTGFKNVNSIQELKLQEPDTEVRLTLVYDTVLFARNNDVYVRCGVSCAAINFKDMGLNLQEGMVLFGSVVGRYVVIDGKAQFVGTENTTDQYYTVTARVDYTTPYYDWNENTQNNVVDDVVETGEVTIDSLADAAGTRRLYACKQNSTTRLLLTDKYGFCQQPIQIPAKCSGLKGILTRNGNSGELYTLTDISTVAQPLAITGLRRDDASADAHYNLAGQKVSNAYRGIIVTGNGRKIIVK